MDSRPRLTICDQLFYGELRGHAKERHRIAFNARCSRRSGSQPTWFRSLFDAPMPDDAPWLSAFSITKQMFVWICYELTIWEARAKRAALDDPDFSGPTLDVVYPIPEQLGAALFQLIHARPMAVAADKFGIDEADVRLIMEKCFVYIVEVFNGCMELEEQPGFVWDDGRTVVLNEREWDLRGALGVVGFTTFTYDVLKDANIEPGLPVPVDVNLLVVGDANGCHMACHSHWNAIVDVPHYAWSNAKVLTTSGFFHHHVETLDPDTRFFMVDLAPNSMQRWNHNKPTPFKERPSPRDPTCPTDEEEDEAVKHKAAIAVIRYALHDLKDNFEVLNGKFFCGAAMVNTCVRSCLIVHNLVRMKSEDFKYFYGVRDNCSIQ